MTPYDNGYWDMVGQLGLSKTAMAAPWVQRVGAGAKNFGKEVLKALIGQPKKFVGEIRENKVLAPGSLLRESLWPKSPWGKALLLGPAGYEASRALMDPTVNKPEELGSILGKYSLGWGAFGPLGLLGSAVFTPVGERIGRGTVRTFNQMAGKPNYSNS
jgi:hypothetical protein